MVKEDPKCPTTPPPLVPSGSGVGGTGRWHGGSPSSLCVNILTLALRWVGRPLHDRREALCQSPSPGWRHPCQDLVVVGPSTSEVPKVTTGGGEGPGTAAALQFLAMNQQCLPRG